jgi:hypothetical protein
MKKKQRMCVHSHHRLGSPLPRTHASSFLRLDPHMRTQGLERP